MLNEVWTNELNVCRSHIFMLTPDSIAQRMMNDWWWWSTPNRSELNFNMRRLTDGEGEEVECFACRIRYYYNLSFDPIRFATTGLWSMATVIVMYNSMHRWHHKLKFSENEFGETVVPVLMISNRHFDCLFYCIREFQLARRYANKNTNNHRPIEVIYFCWAPHVASEINRHKDIRWNFCFIRRNENAL